MLSLVLAKKILSLFLIMFVGALLVRKGMLEESDSKSLSVLMLYVIAPCALLSAYQVDCTDAVKRGLVVSLAAAVVLHIIMIGMTALLAKWLHLNAVEQVSIIYTNAGNLVIPLVTMMLGPEWVIYSTGYMGVQIILMWSHGKAVLCQDRRIETRKILTNPSIIATTAGLLLFFSGIRFPLFVQDALSSVGGMIGPSAMFVMGILLGNMKLSQLLRYRRLALIVALRLVVYSVLITLLMKAVVGMSAVDQEMSNALFVTLFAAITPSACTMTQMARVYGKDAEYANVINVVTTLCCVVTMPLMVALYLH